MEARRCTFVLPKNLDGASSAADASGSDNGKRLRIALITTPRAGNNWLRRLLATAYGIPHAAAANPDEIPWTELPVDCLVGIHWHRTASFEQRLREDGFQVVVMSRHPLDVLISILHFALHDASTARWLEGEEGEERSIYGAMPCSAAFLDYASGRRAAALLAVSREWWRGSHQVRYESLVTNPCGELARLADSLGVAVKRPIAEVVADNTIPQLRASTGVDHHFWQGKPGLWKRLIPMSDGAEIAWSVRRDLCAFGYDYDPDPNLNRRQAGANWIELNRSELSRKLNEYGQAVVRLAEAQTLLTGAQGQVCALQNESAVLKTQLAESEARVAAAQAQLALLDAELTTCQRRLAEIGELGPRTLRLAQALRQCSQRFPKASAWIKRLGRPAA